MLATLVKALPDGPEWEYELKLELCIKSPSSASRPVHRDWIANAEIRLAKGSILCFPRL
jgi:hypothetical protein